MYKRLKIEVCPKVSFALNAQSYA